LIREGWWFSNFSILCGHCWWKLLVCFFKTFIYCKQLCNYAVNYPSTPLNNIAIPWFTTVSGAISQQNWQRELYWNSKENLRTKWITCEMGLIENWTRNLQTLYLIHCTSQTAQEKC
jgi:hypothetical protein